ncbi:MAG: glycosyltransferase family 2 protein [Candidatus Altiarchaeota archaeon]
MKKSITSKNSAQPKVSIILLNWNGWLDTSECLSSLAKVTYPKVEIVVVDNGSTDDSVANIKKKFPRIVLVENEKNMGFAEGNNIGARNATGDVFLFLNNDTVVDPGFLEPLTTEVVKPCIGVVCPKIMFFKPNDTIWYGGGFLKKHYGTWHRGFLEKDAGQYDSTTEVEWASGCALMIRKSLVDKVGLFDPFFFIYLEDVDLSLRVRKMGLKILYIPQAVIWHKESASTKKFSRRFRFLGERNILLLAEKHGLNTFSFYLYDLLHLLKLTVSCLIRLQFMESVGAWEAKIWYVSNKLSGKISSNIKYST